MRATLKLLAEKTKLSVGAVSLILNNKDIRVSPEKRELVLRLAREYNYRPNSLAKGLVTKRSKTVGLILPDITNYFFAETAKYIEAELSQQGYSVILCNTLDRAEEEQKYIDLLLSRGIDALIICVATESLLDQTFLERLTKLDITCVAIDRWTETMTMPHVAVDNREGAKLAVRHLLDHGHRRIACLTGPLRALSARDRLSGYEEALREAGIAPHPQWVQEGDYQFESGYQQGLKLLQEDITAVFVCNDMMAYGIYKAVRESHKKIPDDLSVVGFDDLLFSQTLDVPLTSLKQSTLDIAARACAIVLNELNGKDHAQHVILPPSLSIRKSVKNLSIKDES